MNILTLNEHWKVYEDGTEILLIDGVQIAAIQQSDKDGEFEVYAHDSDFQSLFKGMSTYPYVSKAELRNKVGNLFIGWIRRCVWILESPVVN